MFDDISNSFLGMLFILIVVGKRLVSIVSCFFGGWVVCVMLNLVVLVGESMNVFCVGVIVIESDC